MHQENYPCRIQVVVLPRPVLDVVEGEEEEDMRNNSMIPPRRVVVKMWNIMTRMKILGRGGNETMECQPPPRRVVRIKTEKQRRRRRRGVVVVVVRTWVTSNARQLWMTRILLLRIRTLPFYPLNKRVVAVEMDGNMIRSNDIIDESVNIHNSNIHSKEEKETMKSAIFQNDTIDEQKGIAEPPWGKSMHCPVHRQKTTWRPRNTHRCPASRAPFWHRARWSRRGWRASAPFPWGVPWIPRNTTRSPDHRAV